MLQSRTIAALFTLLANTTVAHGQGGAIREIRLDAPSRLVKEEFTRIAGAFELADGRLLVSDRSDERVLVVDLLKSTSQPVSRTGSGPSEYRMPGRFIRWAGDSVVMLDEGNDRLAIIDPDLRIARSFRLNTPGVPTSLVPRAIDGLGRVYAQVPRWAARGFGSHGDSIPIVRLRQNGTDREVIAWVIVLAEPAGGIKRGLPNIPYSPQDIWAANSRGELIIARAGDYHIERITGKAVIRGPKVPFKPVPVTGADKFAYTKSFLEHSSIGGKGGANSTPSGLSPIPSDMLTREAIDQLVQDNPFATVKAPFTDDLPLLSVTGTFWVTRSLPLTERPVLDGFDENGVQVKRVILPMGRRAIAAGRRSLYAIREDEQGFERLEQYPLPD